MTCTDALHLVEAIAAGDLEVERRVRAHFETCPRCASALASARRLESALRARAEASGAGALHADRARHGSARSAGDSEQRVDRIFNVAIVVAVLLVVGGVAALTNVDAVLGAAGTVWGMVASRRRPGRPARRPVFLTYVAAAGLLMSALVMWWWADRRR